MSAYLIDSTLLKCKHFTILEPTSSWPPEWYSEEQAFWKEKQIGHKEICILVPS